MPAEKELFMVERILGQRERKGKLEYHIKWLGYDTSHNSWEPHDNILDSKLTEAWKQSQQVHFLWVRDRLLPAVRTDCVRACRHRGAAVEPVEPPAALLSRPPPRPRRQQARSHSEEAWLPGASHTRLDPRRSSI